MAARHPAARSVVHMSDRQQRHKVVVTGVSAVTSCGHNIDEMMVNLLAGKSGIDRVTSFDPTPFGCQIGSEVKDFPFDNYIDPKVRARCYACARSAGVDFARTHIGRVPCYRRGCLRCARSSSSWMTGQLAI